MHINNEVGKMIKVLRKTMNITQKDLSDKLGISIQQVHKYENGIDNISVNMIYKIAKVFNCNISLFFPNDNVITNNEMLKIAENKAVFDFQGNTSKKEGDNNKTKDENDNDVALSLLKKFFSLKKNDRIKIIKYIDTILKS